MVEDLPAPFLSDPSVIRCETGVSMRFCSPVCFSFKNEMNLFGTGQWSDMAVAVAHG